MAEFRVLLLEPDETTANFVRHMLTRAGYQVFLASSGKEALVSAWQDKPDAIVVELSLRDLDGLEVVRRLRANPRTAQTPIISLTKRGKPEDTVRGLEAGLTEYIVKQADAVDTLLRVLKFVAEKKPETPARPSPLPRPSDTPPSRAPASPAPQAMPSPRPIEQKRASGRGRLIAFLSAKGGVGTSSICLNISSRIAQQEPQHRVAVVDLVLPIGSLAQITGLTASTDLVRLTELDSTHLTVDFLRTSLPFAKAWGFHLVAGTDHPRRASLLQADRMLSVFNTILGSFDYTAVDVGRNLSRLSLPILHQADVLVMVLSPTPAVVDNTRVVIESLTEDGIPPGKFFILTNRPVGAEDMNVERLESALGRNVDAGIPTMGTDFNLANTLHVPLYLRFPDSTTTLLLNGITTSVLQRARESTPPVRG